MKTSVNKFHNIDNKQSVFADHSGIELEIKNKNIMRKLLNIKNLIIQLRIIHAWKKKSLANKTFMSVLPGSSPSESSLPSQLCLPPHPNSVFRLYFYPLATKYKDDCTAPVAYYNANPYLHDTQRKRYFCAPGEQQDPSEGQMPLGKHLNGPPDKAGSQGLVWSGSSCDRVQCAGDCSAE